MLGTESGLFMCKSNTLLTVLLLQPPSEIKTLLEKPRLGTPLPPLSVAQCCSRLLSTPPLRRPDQVNTELPRGRTKCLSFLLLSVYVEPRGHGQSMLEQRCQQDTYPVGGTQSHLSDLGAKSGLLLTAILHCSSLCASVHWGYECDST